MRKPVIVSLILFAMLVTSCSKPPRHPAPMARSSGYRCIAVNYKSGGHSGISWAINKRNAIVHALKNCRQRSRHPGDCRLKDCTRTKRSSTQYWYTCYVTNRSVNGLWCSTSHNQFISTSRAFERCRRLSGKPAACYFKYCRVW